MGSDTWPLFKRSVSFCSCFGFSFLLFNYFLKAELANNIFSRLNFDRWKRISIHYTNPLFIISWILNAGVKTAILPILNMLVLFVSALSEREIFFLMFSAIHSIPTQEGYWSLNLVMNIRLPIPTPFPMSVRSLNWKKNFMKSWLNISAKAKIIFSIITIFIRFCWKQVLKRNTCITKYFFDAPATGQ